MKGFLKSILLLLLILGVGMGVAGVLYLKDNPSANFLNLLNSEQEKQGVLEKTLQEEVTKRVVVLEENAVIDVIDKSSPAVVSIISETVEVDPFRGIVQDNQGIGTGFIVEGNFIFTNKHVVDNPNISYSVVLNDGKTTYDVTEVNTDPLNDFAILKIDADEETLPTLELGDSQNIKVGQTVIAIGNALGEFGNTASKGIVSGVGRTIIAGSVFGSADLIDNVIQTDAALNPGNSGGPLLDLDGKVIGINVARVVNGDNIGFSIPVEGVIPVFKSFNELGEIQRPFLGIQYSLNTDATSALNRLPIGAVVTEVVPESAAELGGVERFDVITEVGGDSINEDNPLSRIIATKQVGQTIVLTVDRDGEIIELNVTLKVAE
jgi:serine protease Do